MKRVKKRVFFVITLLILLFAVLSVTGFSTYYGDIEHVRVKGVSQIRWGIDIRGGVDVTFTPADGKKASKSELDAASEVMRQRLISLNITDYEVYSDDSSDRIIVRFPWKEDESDFDAETAIKELGDTAVLTFREGNETDSEGKPSGTTLDTVILEGKDVERADAVYAATDSTGSNVQWQVSLVLNESGKDKFSEATTRLAGSGTISIWMDDTMISAPSVNAAITNGEAVISGNFDAESAKSLADKINGGALPFNLETENFSTIDPTLGIGARDAMIIAGIIAFIIICIFMLLYYRLPGLVACIALLGQVAFMLAGLTGFLAGMNSFTLTIPGIAGMILSIGMGVDANIITAERIKEEIRGGKSVDGSIQLGYERAFSAIYDGNLTNIIVAIILLGTFGPPDSPFAVVMKPILFMFPASTEGSIYSFGYTLLMGVIANFLFGVYASKYLMKPVSRFKCFRNPWFYGGKKNVEK